jgi:hypothetical protein
MQVESIVKSMTYDPNVAAQIAVFERCSSLAANADARAWNVEWREGQCATHGREVIIPA